VFHVYRTRACERRVDSCFVDPHLNLFLSHPLHALSSLRDLPLPTVLRLCRFLSCPRTSLLPLSRPWVLFALSSTWNCKQSASADLRQAGIFNFDERIIKFHAKFDERFINHDRGTRIGRHSVSVRRFCP